MDMNGLLHARPPTSMPTNRSLGGNQHWHGNYGVIKISSRVRNETMMPQLSNLWPTQYINYAISVVSDTCIH